MGAITQSPPRSCGIGRNTALDIVPSIDGREVRLDTAVKPERQNDDRPRMTLAEVAWAPTGLHALSPVHEAGVPEPGRASVEPATAVIDVVRGRCRRDDPASAGVRTDMGFAL
jgi:hypothetical protein